ncbi:mitochondrial carrier protein [Ascoidea rubescens DSM 1968]|uniref:Mitochondrial carrier protein n=1 Tax=Ascoidea rubescens DSM 1968 TaxID=1344418 RepID=A0A1D2VCW7_9ASCO|nr:mitochondrial carrier protein [Ascoidea rubescens DSM 1968]ODV59317.1 mitochondrial carrier protein [Ascoidea rubescens DSM 1968]
MAPAKLDKKPINWTNILLGSALNLFEVSTLGQPLEVTKTTMAANRSYGILQAMKHIWSRGGPLGFYQGLIPWAWIEGGTKGAVLLFVSSEAEYQFLRFGTSNFTAGIAGGMLGGVAQAYATMGFCTCMKTAEITRAKSAGLGPQKSTFQFFMDIWRKEGIRGINKGVNAVAIRQCTNWGSRFGLSRLIEDGIRSLRGKSHNDTLSFSDKIIASALGGGLSAWNQPIEIIRVEMQSQSSDPKKPKNLGTVGTLKYIYKTSGIKGLYTGVTPRVLLGVWQTVVMVGLGDLAKSYVEEKKNKKKLLPN